MKTTFVNLRGFTQITHKSHFINLLIYLFAQQLAQTVHDEHSS